MSLLDRDLDQELANILCKGQILNILCVCVCMSAILCVRQVLDFAVLA